MQRRGACQRGTRAGDELRAMASQNAIPSKQHLGGSLPFAFNEEGVADLTAVLKSERAGRSASRSCGPHFVCAFRLRSRHDRRSPDGTHQWRSLKDYLGRYSPRPISEWGALARANAAGGAHSRARRMPPMTARACVVRDPGLPLPCVLKVAPPSWLSQVTGWKPVPPSDLDAKWAISPTETPPPQNVPNRP